MTKVRYSKELLEENVKNCYSLSSLCVRLGLVPKGSNNKTLKKKLNEFNVDYSHFTGQAWNKIPENPVYRGKLIPKLCEHSSLKSTDVKNVLFKLGLKENKCDVCGITEWCGNHIVCELHHINGDTSDNRIENLSILCPNCHSQTHNYRNKNKKNEISDKKIGDDENFKKILEEYENELRIKKEANKLRKRKGILIKDAIEMIKNSPNQSIDDFQFVRSNKLDDVKCPVCGKEFHPKDRHQKFCSIECVSAEKSKNIPSKEDLINSFKETNFNFTKVGENYNVSGNAVVKWCTKYNLPHRRNELIDVINKF